MFRDDDDDSHVGDNDARNDGAPCAISYQTRTEQKFLAKCQTSDHDSISSSSSSSLQLLDPGQVMNALLEQAEELLRRETTHQNLLDNLENLLREDDDESDEDSDSSSGGSTSTSSSGASSSHTPRSAASSRLAEVRDDDDDDHAYHDDNDNESRGGDDIFSNLTDTDLDSRLDGGRSMATHTVFTTGTAATQPAKNVHKLSKQRSTNGGRHGETNKARSSATGLVRRPPNARFPGDNAGTSSFAATQLLQSQIHSALGTHARKALSRPYLRSAERFQESVRSNQHTGEQRRRGSKPTVLPFHSQCGALGNFKWLASNLDCRDPRSRQHQSATLPKRPDGQSERVLRYMRALYLQLPSRSAAYMKRNPRLKRLLPDNPVSLAHPDPFRASSLMDHGYGDRDIERLAESLGGGSADGVLAALSSSSSSAAVPAMQLLTMSTSRNSGNTGTSDRAGMYGAEDGRDEDEDDNLLGQADFGTSADGPASTPVRMWVTNQVFLDLAVTGSLGWVRHHHPRDRSSSSSQQSSPNPYLALINRRSLVPLVVCTASAGRGPSGSLSVLVYATKRRHADQRPALSTRELRCGGGASSSLGGSTDATNGGDGTSYDLPLYSWAKIVVEGNYPHRVSYAVYMAVSDADNTSTYSDDSTSTSYEILPQYVAVHDSFRTPEVVVTGRIASRGGGGGLHRRDYEGCAVVSLCHFRRRIAANNGTCDLFGGGRDRDDDDDEEGGTNDVCTRVSVSTKGWGGSGGSGAVDPTLMLCLGAVVDEFIEKSLRIQSRGLAEAVYRRSQRAL